MNARRGSLVAATWLIGLGAVFLIQQAADLGWSQGWPLFIILVGVASLVSALVSWRPSLGGVWDFTWPIAWIVFGVLLLASTTGNLGAGPVELFETYWPWGLVALGTWFLIGAFVPGRGAVTTLALPLRGAPAADVRLRFGAGTLDLGAAAPGMLVDGSFPGGVVTEEAGAGRVTLSQDTSAGIPWLDHGADWDLGLTAEIPLDLRLEVGAARSTLDLAELQVRHLEIQTGASETVVRLPRAAGATDVRIEAGAASVTLEVPVGVAARIRTRMALGSTQVDEARFPRTADGYESTDYATAANRVDIDAQGGVGSLRVTVTG